MKKELLAPAGNMECLKAAIHNGADAVYLAGKLFGARKYAANFSNEELEEAISYAHLYGVKIYVTVNTIIYENEMRSCLEYLAFLYNIGVDAVIVQDIGLMCLIRKYLPDLEIHASTQVHTHNIEQIKLLESLGVKRVVLAREMTLDEINSLNTSMELEIFIHGALCISYSGQCLFSSGVLNRSGNRGECAGLCRTPFNLISDGEFIVKDKYLLSPKEFNTTNYVENLKKSKAYSFKIEGRMKSPEYVGYVTSIYRKMLDNNNYKLSEEEIFNLKSLYNRGFTKGYLFNNNDKEFISLNSSNHQGVEIGRVVDVNKAKIKIYLTHDIYQGDAIRLPNGEGMYINFLYNEKDMLVNKGLKNCEVYIDNKCNLKNKGSVLLTINSKLVNELKNIEEKKIMIDCKIYAHVKERLIVSYSDGVNVVEFKGEEVCEAKNSPINGNRIKEILSELGNTPFKINNINLSMDNNIFIPVGYLKTLRRKLVEELKRKRSHVKRNIKIELKEEVFNKIKNDNYKLSVFVRNEEQLKALKGLDVDIYVNSEELYQKYKDRGVILRLNRINNEFKEYNYERLLIGETGSLKYKDKNIIYSDYFLNVVNSSYLKFLDVVGVKRICLSPELSMDNLSILLANYKGNKDIEFIIYGKIEYMIMKYNLIKNMNLVNKNNYLEDKNKRRFRIFNDGYTHLMSDKNIDYINDIIKLKNMGVNIFRLEFDLENEKEIKEIVTKVIKIVKSK